MATSVGSLLAVGFAVFICGCGGGRAHVAGVDDDRVAEGAVEEIAVRGAGATQWRPKMTARLSKRCRRVRRTVAAGARAADVDPTLMLAVAWVESGFRSDAFSHAGAVGLMQLLPHVSKAFGCSNPRRPRCATYAAAKLYRRLLARFDGHDVYALCAYNAGAGRVAGAHRRGKAPFNYGYAERVLAARDRLAESGCRLDR